MTVRIEPYKRGSKGARALSRRLGVLRATPKQVRKHGDFNTIINWGSSDRRFHGNYINNPSAVRNAADKAASHVAFRLHDIPSPEATAKRDVAQAWWESGETVVCRQLLRASQGRGIVLASRELGVPVVRAPLYTLYMKKQDEYRVHCAFGDIIDVQHKRKRQEVDNEEVDYQIRNGGTGWVFCRDGVVAPECVSVAALAAVASLKLDFGGVDIGYNTHHETACVYEVNTAPGLEGSTLDSYYAAFAKAIPKIQGGTYRRRRLDAQDMGGLR